MISDVFRVIYDALLQIIAQLEMYICRGNHTRVLFSVVCNRGVNILLQLLHAVFVRDAAEYRFTDDFSVPVDNIGGRE